MHSLQTSVNQLLLVSDAPIARATYETRTVEDQSRDVGSLIFRSAQAAGKLVLIDTMALSLFQAMCYEFGRLEDAGGGQANFVVRHPLKDIAVWLGWCETSAYRPCQRLAKPEVGLVEPFGPRSRAHSYQLRMVPAAQVARANCDVSQLRSAEVNRNCAPHHDLARASCVLSQLRSADLHSCSDEESAKSAFAANAPDAAQVARANCNTADSTSTSTPTLTSTSTHEVRQTGTGGRGDGGERTDRERPGSAPVQRPGLEWFHPWLLSLPALPTDDAGRRNAFVRWATSTVAKDWLDPELALATRIELENAAAAGKPNFNPRGLIISFFKKMPGSISDASRAAAKQQLGYMPPRPAASAGTRIDQLLPPIVGTAVTQNDEEEARELQQTMPQSQLHAIWHEAIRGAPNALVKSALSKSDPRAAMAVRLLIAQKLKAPEVCHV